MKSFAEYHEDETEQLEEGFFRTTSAVVLMNHIRTQRNLVKKSRKVDARTLDALASMVFASASLTFAMTQFQPNTKGTNQT